MKGLTNRQRQVMEFIRSEIASIGRPPTQHEIKDHFGWASTNAVRTHLRLLQVKGVLVFDKNQARGIRLKANPRGRAVRELPFWGQLASGTASQVSASSGKTLGVDPDKFPEDDLFAFTVKGDAMNGAGIFAGDMVIARRQEAAQHKSLVVALIDGEASVKRLFRQGGKLVFRSENPKYRDIRLQPGRNAFILGLVVGLLRRM